MRVRIAGRRDHPDGIGRGTRIWLAATSHLEERAEAAAGR